MTFSRCFDVQPDSDVHAAADEIDTTDLSDAHRKLYDLGLDAAHGIVGTNSAGARVVGARVTITGWHPPTGQPGITAVNVSVGPLPPG